MKILHVLGNLHLPRNPDDEAASGVTRVALDIAQAQVERGHTVSVAVAGQEAWDTTWKGVHLIGLPMASRAKIQIGSRSLDFRQHLPYMMLTHRYDYDIVQGQLYNYLRFLRAGARVVHFHGDPFYRGSKNEGIDLKPADFQNIARYSDAQIAVSEFVGREVRRGLNGSSNVHVVYNGVDAGHFNAQRWREEARRFRQEHVIPPEGVVFLYCGAITSEKGVLHLANAFARLAARQPHVYLLLAGSSGLWGGGVSEQTQHRTYEQQVQHVLEPARAEGRVCFLGKVNRAQMPIVYAASDAVVIPSVWREALTLVALEALASGMPIIGSNIGGIIETFDEYNGIRVEPQDEDDIEAAMHTLATNPDLRRSFGIASQQRVARFSWNTAAQQLDAIYEDVLATRRT